MRAYKLNENLDYSHLWSVGTPGVLSGETALVAQTAILPRTLGTADLAGDLESEGRRTVTATRARLLLSFHQIEECFRQGKVPNVWQAYYRHVFENTFEDCIVENLNYNWGDRQLAPMNSILIPSYNEQHAFTVLKNEMSDFPTYARISLTKYPQIKEHYHKVDGGEMFGAMVAMAEGLIEEILEGSTVNKTAFDSDTSSSEKEDLKRQAASSYKFWKLDEYIQDEQTHQTNSRLIAHFLGTVSYVFTNHSANVVGLILHRNESQDTRIVDAIIKLHRTCMLLFLILWGKKLRPNTNFIVQHVPHKRKMLQDRVVKYCKSARSAQVIYPAEIKAESAALSIKPPRDTHMAYSYLGGGVEWQPPSTYPLVTRGLNLECADRYHALLTFLGNGKVNADMFVCKRSANPTQRLTNSEKILSIEARVKACKSYLQELRGQFGERQKLISWSNIFADENEQFVASPQSKKARIADRWHEMTRIVEKKCRHQRRACYNPFETMGENPQDRRRQLCLAQIPLTIILLYCTSSKSDL